MVALILCFRKLKVRGVISDVLIQKQETSTWAAELIEVKKNGIAMEWQLLTEKKGQKKKLRKKYLEKVGQTAYKETYILAKP